MFSLINPILQASVITDENTVAYRLTVAADRGSVLSSSARAPGEVDAAFRAMRPAVVALIVAPLMGLVKGMKWYLAALSAVVAMAVWYLGVSPMYLIGAGVIVGVAIAVYNGRKEMKR